MRPHPRRSVVISEEFLRAQYLRNRLSTWKIEKHYGYSRGLVYSALKKLGIPVRTLAISHIKYARQDFSGVPTEKAYIIGFAIGDLRVRRITFRGETIKIDCGSTKTAQIDLIKNLFCQYGRVWIGKPNNRKVRQIECFLNLSFDFLLLKRRVADDWIMKNSDTFAAFMAGFIDAEGCIAVNKRGRAYFSLGNYNGFLLRQIRVRLVRLGLHPTKLARYKSKRQLTWGVYRKNGDYWNFAVHRKSSLLALFDLIEPYVKHNDKIKAIAAARQNIKNRNSLFGNLRMEKTHEEK